MPQPIDVYELIQTELRTKHTTQERMESALRSLRRWKHYNGERSPLASYDAIAKIDWSQDVESTRAWLIALLKAMPPGPKVRTLWFLVPEIELNPARTEAVGFAECDPSDDSLSWLGTPNWCMPNQLRRLEKSGKTLPETSHFLEALQQVRRKLKLEKSLGKNGPLCYALPVTYVAFLLAEVCADLDRSLFKAKADPICFLCAFAGGDGSVFGSLTKDGWTSGLQPKPTKKMSKAKKKTKRR